MRSVRLQRKEDLQSGLGSANETEFVVEEEGLEKLTALNGHVEISGQQRH